MPKAKKAKSRNRITFDILPLCLSAIRFSTIAKKHFLSSGSHLATPSTQWNPKVQAGIGGRKCMHVPSLKRLHLWTSSSILSFCMFYLMVAESSSTFAFSLTDFHLPHLTFYFPLSRRTCLYFGLASWRCYICYFLVAILAKHNWLLAF